MAIYFLIPEYRLSYVNKASALYFNIYNIFTMQTNFSAKLCASYFFFYFLVKNVLHSSKS